MGTVLFCKFFFWISCDWRNEQFVAPCFGVSVRAMNIVCGVIGSLMSICPLNINVFFLYICICFFCVLYLQCFFCLVLWLILGGKLIYQTTKKRASGPKCPVTGKRIQGVRLWLFFACYNMISARICKSKKNHATWNIWYIIPLVCFFLNHKQVLSNHDLHVIATIISFLIWTKNCLFSWYSHF